MFYSYEIKLGFLTLVSFTLAMWNIDTVSQVRALHGRASPHFLPPALPADPHSWGRYWVSLVPRLPIMFLFYRIKDMLVYLLPFFSCRILYIFFVLVSVNSIVEISSQKCVDSRQRMGVREPFWRRRLYHGGLLAGPGRTQTLQGMEKWHHLSGEASQWAGEPGMLGRRKVLSLGG